MNLDETKKRLFDNSRQCRPFMRTTASIVLCLLLSHLLLPIVPVSANLVDAGQTENISEKVVAWEQMNDGKILMVTGSGQLSVNSFEAGTHTEVWGLDLNVTANSATIDSGENLVAVAHNTGVVIVQIAQQIVTQYLNTSNPVNAVDWDNDGDIWLGYFAGQRRADEWTNGAPSGIATNAHASGMNTMLITPTGTVLTGGYDNRVKVTSNSGTLIQQLTDMTSAVNVIELDANGRLLVGTAGGDFYRYNLTDYTYEVMTISSSPQIVYLKQMDFATYHVGTQSGELIEVSTSSFIEGNTYDTSGKVIGSLKGSNGEIYIVSGFSSSTRVHLFDIDSDGDGVTDALDAFPTDPSETMDSDGDGVGDNTDEFPNQADESIDSDGDGVGDNTDMFPDNGDQTIDTDGDGYGDNSDGLEGDAYPSDVTQWSDADRDGYGDNPSGTTPDGCPSINGFSTQDRYGCPDSDLDGYSDPDENWTSVQGADALPSDGTQWVDGDGDGYGDNSLGNLPDMCPTKPGTSTRAWLPDPENPQQNTELPSHGCEDTDGDGWVDATESSTMVGVVHGDEHLDFDRDGVGASADYNDDDGRISTERDHCKLNYDDVREVCQGWRNNAYTDYYDTTLAANETPMSFNSWNASDPTDSTSEGEWYESDAMGDALLYGGIIFGGLTVVIVAVGMFMSRRKLTTATKEYGGALPSSAAISEALEGTAGSSATGGVESDSLWDDDVKPLDMQEKEETGFEAEVMGEPSSSEEMFTGDESIESIASMGAEPEPVADEAAPAPAGEAPAEAPPLPASGLPEGWTMDQWKWYGHEYLAKYGNE